MLFSDEAALEGDGVVTPMVYDGEGNVDGVRATTVNPDA
jgi:hypothetical protein